MEKIKEYLNKFKLFLVDLKTKASPKLLELDTKFSGLMPNQKLRKIVYIAIGSLFSFMVLIIILGLLLSPFRQTGKDNSLTINKPKIVVDSPRPEVILSEKQKGILKLQTEINDLKFPESVLNLPVIESNLSF